MSKMMDWVDVIQSRGEWEREKLTRTPPPQSSSRRSVSPAGGAGADLVAAPSRRLAGLGRSYVPPCGDSCVEKMRREVWTLKLPFPLLHPAQCCWLRSMIEKWFFPPEFMCWVIVCLVELIFFLWLGLTLKKKRLMKVKFCSKHIEKQMASNPSMKLL